ncbi:D-alanyl-D-alanine carboxypeptidase family protein [Spirochaeta cellobiosiphila]|uniref:D-alanyl-D-alanine carboxypeptidase family protein n=1 Tax=Spirochaeta cellobiosiphila TaxID=504483 RepID=UPI00146B06D7|nr:D-alanyl-D-alanine carboxypeptidase family protein [Spirochaeta cellobiosiphila]
MIKKLPFIVLSILISHNIFGFDTIASSAILIEETTGQIIYEKSSDMPIPPASITKLMTLDLVYKKIKSGQIKLDDYVPIPYEGTLAALPPFSSHMGLYADMRVTLDELIRGTAVMSGNDAANTLAITIAGDIDSFVDRMNQEALDLGLSETHFDDPSGLSEKNITTARDLAKFARIYIRNYPDSLKLYHSQHTMTFPKEDNWIFDNHPNVRVRTKQNTNLLIGAYPGADGLKTGYIDESGFNIAVTAKQGDYRLIGILLGINTDDYMNGIALRAQEAARLLDYGFKDNQFITPPIPDMSQVQVWLGDKNWISPSVNGSVKIVVPNDQKDQLRSEYYLKEELMAPFPAGTELGSLTYYIGDKELAHFTLESPTSVNKGPWYKVAWHKILLFFRDLMKPKSI